MSYIDVSGLFFGYTNDSLLFRNISLSFRLGEQVAIIGRNGSGKTSLVKLLNGMLKPQKGNISINKESTRDKSIADIATTIGFVFQNPNQMLFMNSVEKELELSLLRLSLGKEEQNKRINKMLSFFDLEKYRETHPRSLSRGEKQKLALATVLIQEPQAIILDEPFSGIDFNQRNNLIDYLRILCDEGKLIILITHDIDSIMENCSRVIALDEGNIIYDLPVDEFLLDETNLRKIGLLPTNYLKMIYQLRSKGLPKEILWKKDFIEFFKQTLEL
ncbi:MAG: ABC transporter ATP-binding protein [Candidatus Heimdallarchaeota archaeon]|nr:ABC transporter ATP-binding protein [Candidatus Heimdallarchaeota archaeon]MBY8995436.1 ABC transporter ATP-binding protein [Candidatus Heimdallarchaeota archaeon]